jgi:hypothetical protein
MAFVRTGLVVVGRPRGRFGVRDRGFGSVAPCPSLQQLQGIVDLSDPCQQEISAAGDTVVPAYTPAEAAAAAENIASMTLGPSTFLGVPMPYAILGGVVLALALIPSGRRRR